MIVSRLTSNCFLRSSYDRQPGRDIWEKAYESSSARGTVSAPTSSSSGTHGNWSVQKSAGDFDHQSDGGTPCIPTPTPHAQPQNQFSSFSSFGGVKRIIRSQILKSTESLRGKDSEIRSQMFLFANGAFYHEIHHSCWPSHGVAGIVPPA